MGWSYRLMLSAALALLDTVKVIRGADEDLVVDGDWAGQRVAVELVDTEDLESRSHLHDRRRALFINAIDLSIREQRGGAVSAGLHALSLVHDLPRIGFQAIHHAVVAKNVDILAVRCGRWHVGTQIIRPELVLTRDITGATSAEGNKWSAARAGREYVAANYD